MKDTSLFIKAIRIIFDRDFEERIDLFQVFPRLKLFFKRRRLHAVLRTIGDVTFTFIIVMGLFGPQDPKRNCSLFLAWGLWWPTVVLSWFFVGRMWCGFCPFPGIGRLLQGMGLSLNLKLPRFLKKNGIYLSVILLGLIIWVEESTGLKQSPRGTALLILSILAGVTLCAIFFPKQAWCRYLCPMGRMIGVASIMSLTEFRPDHEKCKKCTTFACKRGKDGIAGCPVYLGAFNVTNNLYCLVCGHCLKLCELDSPQLNLRSPFKELIINKGRFITCSYIIPFFIGSQLARLIQERIPIVEHLCLSSLTCRMGMFSVLLLIGFIYAYMFIRIGAKLFRVTEDELFGKFSPMVPALLPMAFTGELIYRLNFSLFHAQDFLPVVGRQFEISSLLNLTFHIPSWFFTVMDIYLMILGALASVYVLYRFVHEDFEGLITWWGYRGTQTIVLIIFLSYISILLY